MPRTGQECATLYIKILDIQSHSSNFINLATLPDQFVPATISNHKGQTVKASLTPYLAALTYQSQEQRALGIASCQLPQKANPRPDHKTGNGSHKTLNCCTLRATVSPEPSGCRNTSSILRHLVIPAKTKKS